MACGSGMLLAAPVTGGGGDTCGAPLLGGTLKCWLISGSNASHDLVHIPLRGDQNHGWHVGEVNYTGRGDT